MFKYACLNNISDKGLEIFTPDYEKTDKISEAQGILVRSAAMHDMEFSPELLAIARAGAGVNNIPLDRCSREGIVVFNTPGANANGVKEMVLAGMLLASRDIVEGVDWVRANWNNADIAKTAERKEEIRRYRACRKEAWHHRTWRDRRARGQYGGRARYGSIWL